MLREGKGEPLVLLHGVTGAEGMWGELMPLLAPHHDTIALTALGHRGGRPPATRPARIADIVDDAERSLDELGLERPHLAGNSMGGWMALELARRGRARSVCALSPAGTWPTGDNSSTRTGIRSMARDARRARPLLPLLLRSKRMRRYALSLNADHGERLSPRFILERVDDLLGCSVVDDVLDSGERLPPIDPLPCPITIAWSQHDRVLPLGTNGEHARELVPRARFLVLENVGHVPLFDDPRLVAETILEAAR